MADTMNGWLENRDQIHHLHWSVQFETTCSHESTHYTLNYSTLMYEHGLGRKYRQLDIKL